MFHNCIQIYLACECTRVFRFRCNFTSLRREYSVFPKHYIEPIYRKDDQEAVFQSEEATKLVHERVKPAKVTDTCSEFYDARVL